MNYEQDSPPPAQWLGLIFTITLALAVPVGATEYTITDMGAAIPGKQCFAKGINENSQLLLHCRFYNQQTTSWTDQTFLQNNGQFTDIGTLGRNLTVGNDLNDAGQVVGVSWTSNGAPHAFLYSNGQMTDLVGLQGNGVFISSSVSTALGINASGQVVGFAPVSSGSISPPYYTSAYSHAFLYSNGQMLDLGTLGGSFSWAYDINDSGQVVGGAYLDDGQEGQWLNGQFIIPPIPPTVHAFLYDNSQMTDLGTLGGLFNRSGAKAINSSGQIVGASGYDDANISDWGAVVHAFLYSNGQMTDLGTLGGNISEAWDINDNGQIVGLSTLPGDSNSGRRAFLYGNGQMTDLNTLLPANSGWQLLEAYVINNKGQIIGRGVYNGQETAFLMSPVPDTPDSDGDGVEDSIDTGDGSFTDSNVPPTTGVIVDRGGLTVTVQDADDSADGVLVSVGSGTGSASLSVCGYPVQLEAGSATILTCGSLELSALQGTARVLLDGGTTVVEVPINASAKITDNPDGTYTLQNTGSVVVSIKADNAAYPVEPGNEMVLQNHFHGFFAPVDMGDVLNKVKAGAAVPLKFRVTRVDGSPIVDLTSVSLHVTALDCDFGATADLLEEVAAGDSGLQNLGAGNYQINWKSPKIYAGSCKTLYMDMGNGLPSATALFQLTKN